MSAKKNNMFRSARDKCGTAVISCTRPPLEDLSLQPICPSHNMPCRLKYEQSKFFAMSTIFDGSYNSWHNHARRSQHNPRQNYRTNNGTTSMMIEAICHKSESRILESKLLYLFALQTKILLEAPVIRDLPRLVEIAESRSGIKRNG